MKDRNRNQKFWIFFSLLTALFFLIKYQGPSFVHHLYHQEQFNLLNAITASPHDQRLDFYLGMVEDHLFGPLQTLISGLLFLAFALRFLKEASLLKFGTAVLVYFLLTRFEVLFYPPYGELVTGPMAPAGWLARNSFDYIGLLHQESFTKGGPRTFSTSIYPMIVAALMHFSPTSKTFLVIFHTIVFACAAYSIAIFRTLASKFFSKETAIISSVLVCGLPLYQSMAEQLNMAMVNLFFAILTVHYLFQKRIVLASIMSLLAMMIKAPGGIACATVLLVCLVWYCTEPPQSGRLKYLGWGLGVFIFAAVKFMFRSKLMGDQPDHNKVSFLGGWPWMKDMTIFWLYGIALVIFLGGCVYWWSKQPKEKRKISLFLREHLYHLIMFVMAGFWYVLYLNFSVMGYRYQVLLAPFYVFTLVYAASLILRQERLMQWSLIAVTAVTLWCSHGLIYDRTVQSSIYSYHKFERSLEYRNDLKLHMLIAQEIEDKYSHLMIGAPHVVAQKLGLLEFGYVQKPLDVMIYGINCTYGGIKNFIGLKFVDIENTVWVGFFKNHINAEIPFPIGPHDTILKKFVVGNKEAAIFKGGYAIENVRILIELSQKGLLQGIINKYNQNK